MIENELEVDKAGQLRARALEKAAGEKKMAVVTALSPLEIANLVHELQVHQIELEMQNDELRRAQVELEASRERYFEIFDLAPVGYLILNQAGLILEANLTASSLLGIHRGAMINSSFHRFVIEVDRVIYHQQSKKLTQTGLPQACDIRIKRGDGSQFWAQVDMSAGLDVAGGYAQRVVLSDITERKQAQDALRESEQQYRDMFEKNTAIKLFIDPGSGAILRANQAAAGFYGYPIAGLEKMNISQINTLPAPEIELEMEQAASQNRQYFNFRHRLASGELRDVEVYSGPIQSGGRIGLYSIIHDVTGRKKAEAELLQANAGLEQRVQERTAELQAANLQLIEAGRMKDEFLASMSHELRTPLTGILGLSDCLELDVYGPMNEKQAKAVSNIHKSGQHLLKLINDILDLAKIGAGKLSLDLQRCSLAEVCQASLQMIHNSAEQKGQHVSFQSSPENIMLQADPRRLLEILVNLLSNAVKFTPQDGSIGIQARGEPLEGQVAITVWDSGIGIKDTDVPLLFQRFVQIDARLARNYSGTGLGLALVKNLSELHGGSVSVESKFGAGSRFTVKLPWAPGPAD
jgi:PAS domain S-box-containing protein